MFRTVDLPQVQQYERHMLEIFPSIKSRSNTRDHTAKSVFTCFTNRSGSTFLGEALFRCGVLPCVAQELFNVPVIQIQAQREEVTSFEQHCVNLIKTNGGPEMFVSKIAIWQLMFMCKHGIVGSIFREPRFIYIKRQDVLAQAISFSIADQTKIWTSKHLAQREPRFDRGEIGRRIAAILLANAKWEEFFAINGISPHRVVYEDLCNDPQSTIEGIAAWLGKRHQPFSPDRIELHRQTGELNLRWKRLFLETGDELRSD